MTAKYSKWADVRAKRTDLTDEGQERAREAMEAAETGYRLAQFRKEAGLTQTELAEAMGVSQNRVSVIERGDPERMELDTVRSYIEALGGTMSVTVKIADRSIDVRTWASGKVDQRKKTTSDLEDMPKAS